MRSILSILTLLFCLPACAQSKHWMAKAYGYYMIPMPGTIPVDERGEPFPQQRDSVFTVFVETGNDKMQWEKAWKSGRSFSLTATAIKESKVAVGISVPQGSKIELSPTAGNVLWRLLLTDDKRQQKAPQPVAAGEILVQGRLNTKVVYVRAKTLKELASPLYQ